VRVLLDTSTFITASTEGIGNLSRSARQILEDPETDRLLCALSYSEIAIKVAIGKLKMDSELVSTAVAYLRLTVIPYTPAHAQSLFKLPYYAAHRDPFDRMLIATAMAENVPLVSSDKEFKRYKGLRVIR
jgi:PIN domain nuclease of toxin-antitoxin system